VRLPATPRNLFIAAVAGQFLFGIVLALPGTLFGLPQWTGALGFDVAAQARLLVVFFAGQFVCTALAGTLVDRVGCQRVLSAGSLLIGLALVLLAGAETAVAANLPAVLLAAGGASINASSNTLISVVYGERRGAMLSLMATFGASGALMAPVIFAGGLDAHAVTARLLALALASTLAALAPLAIAPAHEHVSGPSLAATFSLLKERPLLGLIALLALEFGDEAVMAGWTAAFTIAVFPGASGALLVGLYWGGLCLGRLMSPLVLARMPKLVVVLAASLTTAAAIATMALSPTTAVLSVAVVVAGLAVGPMAPTIVSVAGDRYPRQVGAAIGLLLSVAQLGGMVLPWLTGRATIAYGYRAGLAVPAIAALGIACGTALVWHGRARRVPMAAEARAR
jgi:MFS family permease